MDRRNTETFVIMRRLWKEIVYSSAAKIYSLVLAIGSLILTARWLGPAGRGHVVAVTTWVGLFSTVGGLSLGQIALHRATTRRHQEWLASTLGSLLTITGAISLLSWSLAAALFLLSHGMVFDGISPGLLTIGFVTLPFMIWEQYGSSLLTALDKLRIYNNAQMFGRTVGFVLVIVFIRWLRLGVTGVLISMFVAQLSVSCAGLRHMFCQVTERVRPDLCTIGELVNGGVKLHLNAIGSFLYMSTDILLISRYRGPTETGHYQMAVQMGSVLLMIPQAASMVIFGRIVQQGPDEAWPHQRKILLWLTFAVAGIAAVSAMLAPWMIPFVVGNAFSRSVGVFQLMLIGLVGMTFTTMMGPQWFGRGLFLQAAMVTLVCGVLNLIANCVLVPQYGMYGSVWATLGTYVLSVLINIGMAIWVERNVRTRNRTAIMGEPAVPADVIS
jgi:O-antigen/teichoic acid export membrane protein